MAGADEASLTKSDTLAIAGTSADDPEDGGNGNLRNVAFARQKATEVEAEMRLAASRKAIEEAGAPPSGQLIKAGAKRNRRDEKPNRLDAEPTVDDPKRLRIEGPGAVPRERASKRGREEEVVPLIGGTKRIRAEEKTDADREQKVNPLDAELAREQQERDDPHRARIDQRIARVREEEGEVDAVDDTDEEEGDEPQGSSSMAEEWRKSRGRTKASKRTRKREMAGRSEWQRTCNERSSESWMRT
jgi:hypothetical protein